MAVEKSVVRSVRFSPEEWGRVERWAGEAEVSPSRYVREATLRRRPQARPAGVRADAVTALNRVGVNLNQLVRLLHQARRDHAAAGGAAAGEAARRMRSTGTDLGANRRLAPLSRRLGSQSLREGRSEDVGQGGGPRQEGSPS
ncbi:plasmid mobilization protein [Rubrivirga litoralis]|uniref:plasmid mobilization protein n=1 Tax=Rubrivirga litoralis TaxID=3075598 RepID=UPI003D77F0E1